MIAAALLSNKIKILGKMDFEYLLAFLAWVTTVIFSFASDFLSLAVETMLLSGYPVGPKVEYLVLRPKIATLICPLSDGQTGCIIAIPDLKNL